MDKDKIGIYIRKGGQSLTNEEDYTKKANKLIELYCDDVIDRELLDEKMAELKVEYGRE